MALSQEPTPVVHLHPGWAATDVVALERKLLARELVEEIRWLDKRIPVAKQRLSQALAAYGTTLTDICGIGEIGAATILSIVDDPNKVPRPWALRRV